MPASLNSRSTPFPCRAALLGATQDAFFTALTGEWDEPAYEQSERNHRGYQPDAASAHVPVLFCPLPGASIPSHLQLSPGATEHVDSPHP
eukprot:362504-Chlamydomonas_euryale.AAC.10